MISRTSPSVGAGKAIRQVSSRPARRSSSSVAGQVLAQVQPQFRIGTAQMRQGARQEIGRDRGDDAEPDPARQRRLARARPRRPSRAHRPAAPSSARRLVSPAAVSVVMRLDRSTSDDADGLLQLADRIGERRLRDIGERRGPAERAGLGKRDEILHLAERREVAWPCNNGRAASRRNR